MTTSADKVLIPLGGGVTGSRPFDHMLSSDADSKPRDLGVLPGASGRGEDTSNSSDNSVLLTLAKLTCDCPLDRRDREADVGVADGSIRDC